MATSTDTRIHRETEVKLDADTTFVLPDLAPLPGVAAVRTATTQRLRATYVDSADLALLRHGVTFRRRTGGDDAGWHLKLPVAGDTRTEVHRPVGRGVSSVPDDLTALTRVHLRGAAVTPVARITTDRTVHQLLDADERVLAEVADDRVTGEALGDAVVTDTWREIEVELVTGDDVLLAAARAALLAAGARPPTAGSKLARILSGRLGGAATPPAADAKPGSKGSGKGRGRGRGKKGAAGTGTAGEVAVRYLAEQVRALLRQDPQVRMDAEEGVHQMRVATRRARTALATFRPLFEAGTVETLRAELKWLAGVLGEARDAEVMRARLKADVAALPSELVLGPVARRIDLELHAAYRTAHDHVVEALDSDRYLALVRDLEQFVARPPFGPRAGGDAAAEVRVLVGRAVRRVRRTRRLVGEPGAPERDEHLHEVRIAAKRARYAAESARPVAGDKAHALAKAMEQVQEILGDHQDAVVQRTWLRDLGVRAHGANENGFTFGLLHGLTALRAEHDEEKYVEAWRQARDVSKRWPG